MADTQRTRSAILTLFADNVTGQISAQDLRDFAITIMNGEFVNEGDFWAQPDATNTDTSDTGRGWKQYSQLITSYGSFGLVMVKSATGDWHPGGASVSIDNCVIGICMSNYVSNDTSGIILRKGMVYHSDMSTDFNGNNARPVYINSCSGFVSALAVDAALSKIVGYVVDDVNGKWFFDPTWAVVGV